ncbi:hypothetical protein WN51_05946 [Melipona quadrifasciata]|uniref:Uncharacterized protein n=1 Tax=Melipona quadrifasciata TaxID=166423 RepID=A0A0N0U6N1_9HYME|nr:hypothetical protein WN51_05946 [Melipona quadrifasciata]
MAPRGEPNVQLDHAIYVHESLRTLRKDLEYPRKKPTIHLTVTTPFSPSNQHQKEMVFLHPEGRKSRNLQFHLSTLLPRVHPGASYLPNGSIQYFHQPYLPQASWLAQFALLRRTKRDDSTKPISREVNPIAERKDAGAQKTPLDYGYRLGDFIASLPSYHPTLVIEATRGKIMRWLSLWISLDDFNPTSILPAENLSASRACSRSLATGEEGGWVDTKEAENEAEGEESGSPSLEDYDPRA